MGKRGVLAFLFALFFGLQRKTFLANRRSAYEAFVVNAVAHPGALLHIGRIDEARQLARELSRASERLGSSGWEHDLRRKVAELLAETGDTPGALTLLAAEYDPSDALRTVIEATAETASLGRAPEEGAKFWSLAVSGLTTPQDRAIMLSRIAQELHSRGESAQAMRVLAEALWTSRKLYRGELFAVLKRGTHVLASVQQGELLGQIYDAFVRTDRWWSVDKQTRHDLKRPTQGSSQNLF